MFITAANLAAIHTVSHGFFTRKGGVSEGIYASLNCGRGSGDDAARIDENRRRAAKALGTSSERLCNLYQVHGKDVITAEQCWGQESLPKADAMVTNRPGIALGILTADCVPVLLADAQAGVIGAAHAGWRGALAGVIEKTAQAMVKLGATSSRIAAAVGPAIAQNSYEVGASLREEFTVKDATNARY